jgi:hypothetical protein
MNDLGLVIGVGARLVFWVMIALIVGNAAIYLASEGAWLFAILSVAFLPFTAFIWPFSSPEAAYAWPLDNSSGLIYFFIAAAIAYPISTLIGGLPRV